MVNLIRHPRPDRGSPLTFKYYESFSNITRAIAREKQLKHFKRVWKDELVNALNPEWCDLIPDIIEDPAVV